MRKLPIISLLLLMLALTACDKGKVLDNQAPETKLFVTSIELTGPNRLTSNVTLHWDGSDIDGYVKGFEISFDQNNWEYLTSRDSLFIFTIPPGSDTFDYDFWVRAVDNQDLRDPSPAYLKIPVKNTPPTIEFDSIFVMPDTAFVALSIKWIADDADGLDNLDSVYIKMNSGSWVPVDPTANFATLVAQSPENSGSVNADLYLGIPPQKQNLFAEDMKLEEDNIILIRAKDQSGSFSEVDTSKVIFIRNKKSDLLVIDSYKAGGSDPESIYFPILSGLTGGYDYINIEANAGANLPQPVNPTFGFLINLYDRVFWYSDASTLSDGIPDTDDEMYVELAASIIQNYLTAGGKLLMTVKLPNNFENTSALFDFSPMDSVSTSKGQARIIQNQLQSPYGTYAASWDTLESDNFITGAQPFYPKDSSNIMYTSEITPVLNWVGPDVICARSTNAGNTNLVFMSIALHELNGRPAALSSFLLNVLNDEFNW